MTNARHEPALAELVSFEWCRVTNPEWVDHAGSRTLLAGDGPVYRPLRDEPTLFRRFAALEETERAYSDFAVRYGLLAEDATSGLHLNSCSGWVVDRRKLAYAVRLWDALRQGQTDDVLGVDVMTRPLADGLVVYVSYDACGSDVMPPYTDPDAYHSDSLLLGTDSPSGFGAAALAPARASSREVVAAALRAVVDANLRENRVAPALAPTRSGLGAGLRLTFSVEDLLGAIWLQLALAIDGNREYRVCQGCNEPWDATGARASRDYCSERCRQRIVRASKPKGGGDDGR